MKAHTSSYKENIKEFGCEIDAKITYQLNNETIELGAEELNSVVPHYEGAILKSVMKQLDLDSNVDIPLNTILNAQFGVKVGNEYEYISFGNFVVYSSEKQEDTDSWRIVCYDKMLYSMKNYEKLDITYPITIRNYINEICTHLGLTFANASGVFVNYDKEIQSELYLDGDDNTLGYTFRNVLDELAQTTASTICINDDDELEVRYINDAVTSTNEVEGSEISISDVVSPKIVDLKLKGNTSQESTTGDNLIDFLNPSNTFNCSYNSSTKVYTSNALTGDWIGLSIYTYNTPITINAGENIFYYSADIRLVSGTYTYKKINLIRTGSNFSNVSTSLTTVSNPNLSNNFQRYIFKAVYTNNGENTINDYNFFVQLASGASGVVLEIKNAMVSTSENSIYEPYTGGIPAPNPDYPMPINVVSGDNTITLCGKNLFDGEVENGYININTGENTGSNNVRTKNYIPILPNTQYTISDNEQHKDTWGIFYDKNKSYLSYLKLKTYTNNSGTFTTPSNTQYIRWYNAATSAGTNVLWQLEKSSSATPYEPYQEQTYPINLGALELCKIDGYQDCFKKSTGKNLADINDTSIGHTWSNATNTQRATILWIPLIEGQRYTLASSFTNTHITQIRGVLNKGPQDIVSSQIVSESFDAPSGWGYISIEIIADTTFTIDMLEGTKILFCKGNATISDYEPYDVGVWYLHKEIGKVVLDGSEDWTDRPNYGYADRFVVEGFFPTSSRKILSDYFTRVESGLDIYPYILNNDRQLVINFSEKGKTTLEQFKTWLSTHNTTVYYVLSTPTITEITDTTLISQLNAIKLFKGTNNIEFSGTDIAGILNIKYTTGIDTIDEDYLKDVNVTFGQKYGPVNSVVLSRSAESDNVYLQDEDSVEKNGLCEIKITDNQIMNFNDRSDYLPGILNELDGLEYYINDFSSPGITYYDLCDRYNVQVGESTYPCVMLNDEVNITQGLEEIIYTEEPEGTVTDYTKADKTDQRINQAYIIVDKQNQEISTLTKKTTDLDGNIQKTYSDITNELTKYATSDDLSLLETSVQTLQTDTYTKTQVNAIISGTDADGRVVNYVKSGSMTFDINGLTIEEETSEEDNIKSNLNAKGLRVMDNYNSELLYAGFDATTRETIVRSKNLKVEKYFEMGSYSRFEDYTDEDGNNGTGCFWVGD